MTTAADHVHGGHCLCGLAHPCPLHSLEAIRAAQAAAPGARQLSLFVQEAPR